MWVSEPRKPERYLKMLTKSGFDLENARCVKSMHHSGFNDIRDVKIGQHNIL